MDVGGSAVVDQQKFDLGLSEEELKRIKLLLKAFPDDEAAKKAVELFKTYQSFEHLGKIFLAILKIAAVISAGIIALSQLRGMIPGWGRGG
jgi:hypothetical protein